MASGIPLTDEDRQPWLQSIQDLIIDLIQQNKHAIIACSALKEIYRNKLHVKHIVQFVYLFFVVFDG